LRTPETKPVAELTVAIEVEPQLHVPPVVAQLISVVKPTQTLAVPVIASGLGLTVTILVVEHPVGNIYETTAVPLATPVTTPVAEPTTAILVLLQLQVPPVVAQARLVLNPVQTFNVPVIVAGSGFTLTVTFAVLLHPFAFVPITV
jgi:hypothetical protein